MTQGRGAWTERGKDNGSIYYSFINGEPLDGTEPIQMPEDPLGIEDASQPDWYNRVHRGVLGIQRLLRINGISDVPLTGIFDQKTHKAAVAFQAKYPDTVGVADGRVGPKTSKQLLHIVILSASSAASINPKYLYAIGCQETQMDLGGQGQLNAPDSGWLQFNLAAGTDNKVTDQELDDAYNPGRAANKGAHRFHDAWHLFGGHGFDLRESCTLAQHNDPSAAQQWFNQGFPPNDEIAHYVDNLLGFAQEWVA